MKLTGVNMKFDLLHEELIQTDRSWVSLPGLLAAMARGEVQSLPAQRPHQRPAWHMFTVQLAVLALDALGLTKIPEEEAIWRSALRALTPAFPDDEPWHLVGPADRPAFLQPADPGGLKWTDVATPDSLDMLITARNHEVKREIARKAAPQDWLFALVSLQTMEGYGGGGGRLHGIARMNKGNSSRVLIGLAPASGKSSQVDPSAWWRRDVSALLGLNLGKGGKSLLWLFPWPEGQSFSLEELDPLFIEVCRRIRLNFQSNRLSCSKSTSGGPRVAASDALGNTGDPWAPVHIVEGKSLTIGERTFDYQMLVSLLFSQKPAWRVPVLARPQSSEDATPMLIVAEAISRGNSKTDGFQSRIVPVPKAMVAAGLFGERPVAVAADLLTDIAAVDKALRDGLALVAAAGDQEKKPSKYEGRSLQAREALRRWADLHFFDALWQMATARSDADFRPLRLAFLEKLASAARVEFQAALPAIPCSSLMRPRAETRGRQRFETGLFNAMKDLREAIDA